MATGVFIFGLISWKRTGARAYLLVGMGFLCFGISHVFKVVNSINEIPMLANGTPFDWFLIGIRIVGYLLCLWAVISAK
jgi:hypothetical protein